MADKSFLDWPFFEARHRAFAKRLDDWAAGHLGGIGHGDVDAACRSLVAALGRDGWLEHTAPDPGGVKGAHDVRTIALARETLARHSGLADFAFAMQGLGAGPISLYGSAAQRKAWLTRTVIQSRPTAVFGSKALPRGEESTMTTRLPSATSFASAASKPSSTHSVCGVSILSGAPVSSPVLW